MLSIWFFVLLPAILCAFSALTLLVGQLEGHPACKNWVVGCWCGYPSGVRCRLAYGPADATATHCLLLQWNPDWFYHLWYRLTRVVPEKWSLNGCVCLCVCVCVLLSILYDHVIMYVGLFHHSAAVFHVFYVLLTVCVVVFFSDILLVYRYSCIAVSLFNKLTYLHCCCCCCCCL